MTESQSDAAALAERFAGIVGSDRWTAEHGTAKVYVDRSSWVEAHASLKEELPFFSWLSAIDWAADVHVGEPPESQDIVDHYEVLSRLADVTTGAAVVLATEVSKDDAEIPSLTGVYGGANWHEREAAEMFGIAFSGHPNLTHLYLPDGFEGHPLRKTYPLLSRKVKPWPGSVDVEDMPSTENPEDTG